MTQDEIIRMARDAGSIDSEDVIETVYAAFAAAEREACITIVKNHALGYAEPVWAVEIINDMLDRGQQ